VKKLPKQASGAACVGRTAFKSRLRGLLATIRAPSCWRIGQSLACRGHCDRAARHPALSVPPPCGRRLYSVRERPPTYSPPVPNSFPTHTLPKIPMRGGAVIPQAAPLMRFK